MLPWLRSADRRSLLTGTALASTLLLSSLLAPTPAAAIACTQPPSPTAINNFSTTDPIICINTEPRTAVSPGDPGAIFLFTTGEGHYINLYNSGTLTGIGDGARGIGAFTGGPAASVTVINVGDITTDGQQAYGIQVGAGAPPRNGQGGDGGAGGTAVGGPGGNAIGGVNGANGGNASANGAFGLAVYAPGVGAIVVNNSADITTSGLFSHGISARATSNGGYGGYGGAGGTAVSGAGGAGDPLGGNGGNGGNASANGGDGGAGASGDSGNITIVNSGTVRTFGVNAAGVYAGSEAGDPFAFAGGAGGTAVSGPGGPGSAGNGGAGGSASANGGASGAASAGHGPDITIVNSGDITTYGASAYGMHIRAFAGDARSDPADGGAGGTAVAGTGATGGLLGGAGGAGGSASANGGNGGATSGGAGGNVTITNYARVSTFGNYADAIFINTYGGDALSGEGGVGGTAVSAPGAVGGAGNGGAGGSTSANGGAGGTGTASAGGDTVFVNYGEVATSGNYTDAIRVRSFAGFGEGDSGPGGNAGAATAAPGAGGGTSGDGGAGGNASANGGNGGDAIGGNGGDVSIVNNGSVVSAGNFGNGMYVVAFASSGFGGNGGNGFSASGAAGGAGSGGNGGNGGSAQANGGKGGDGIGGDGGDISIVNNGSIVTSGVYSRGIFARTSAGSGTGGTGGNGGNATGGNGGVGGAGGGNGGNGGDASANGGDGGLGQGGNAGNITIVNAGDITTLGAAAHGIFATSSWGAAYSAEGAAGVAGTATNGADGLSVIGGGEGGTGGTASATAGAGGRGIGGDSGSIDIENSGSVVATGDAVRATVIGGTGTVRIVNSGSLFGGGTSSFTDYYGTHIVTGAGIYSNTPNATTIVNSGYLSAASLLAIQSAGPGDTQIVNSGLIVGYVLLDADDTFINENGGVFETKLVSDFGPGNDLFRNEQGGTVLAATNPNASEYSSFIGLERFENQGLISLQDGKEGDVFRISNVPGLPGQYFSNGGIAFNGSGKSTLAVDAFLGGPGSKSDVLIIDGDVSGKTEVKVNNTNSGLGVFNSAGIPVVYVGGHASGDEFFLKHPIDAGFFDYDLFFRPTGSGVFEFQSFLNGQALLLPQLETAMQDMWHQGSDTWFDRTADLRVLLNGGAPVVVPSGKLEEATPAANIAPAVWARGSGAWLSRDDSETVNAFGQGFRFNLNRDLETADFQTGLDLGKRGLLADNDILIFGVLGGYVHGDLDYDALGKAFDFDGGQVGGYATYSPRWAVCRHAGQCASHGARDENPRLPELA